MVVAAGVVVVALLAVAAVVIHHGTVANYAFAPGTAPQIVSDPACRARSGGAELVLPGGTPCANLSVPAARAHRLRGSLFMVDVLVGPATPADYVLAQLHLLSSVHPGTQLVPSGAVLGSTPPSQLPCQDTQQMQSATENASVAALRRLGYAVAEHHLGAQVDLVAPGSAAAKGGVHCNDVVTAFDGSKITSASQLVSAIHAVRPGQKAVVTVRRPGPSGRATQHTLHVDLTGTPAQGAAPANPAQAFLGIATSSQVTYSLPFGVHINVGNIGGPSAGLALTLGLVDLLSNGDLTGGHRVAATGTIDTLGTVGDVGGVAQKTVAVQRAGAQLFLVPPQELAVARRHARPGMKVEAVGTLAQALSDLAAIGGHVPPPQHQGR